MNDQEVFKKIQSVVEKLKECKFEDNEVRYIAFLTQTYFFVRHSVHLLEFAIEHSQNENFIKRCKEHIKEEDSHDLVVLNDLKQMGIIIEDEMEWSWTKRFYSNQYQIIEQVNGELLLGYILALEGIAVLSAPHLAPIQNKYGKKATRFAKIHVEEDQDHLPSALSQVKMSQYSDDIFRSFENTLVEYSYFVDCLKEMRTERKIA